MQLNSKHKGILSTILFHLALVLILLFTALTTPLPLPEEEGVEVNLGYSEEGMGMIQDEQIAPPQPAQDPVIEEVSEEPPSEPEQNITSPAETVAEEVVTQDTEEAVAMPEDKKEEKAQEKPVEITPEPQKPAPTPKEKPKEPEKPKVNTRALYKGNTQKGSQSSTNGTATTGNQQGYTGNPGDQGKPHGSPTSNNYEGEGGQGNGISFNLGNRKAKHLPKPAYKSQEQGKVVVTIYVDKYGNVTRAEPGAKGTTVSDTHLHKLAQQAALQAKFSPDTNAPSIQKGTITYLFIRLN